MALDVGRLAVVHQRRSVLAALEHERTHAEILRRAGRRRDLLLVADHDVGGRRGFAREA